MEAKKKYHPDPLPVKTAIQLQRHEGFWKKKNRSKKKKRFHRPWIEPSSVTTKQIRMNQLRSARYRLELTKQQWEIIVL